MTYLSGFPTCKIYGQQDWRNSMMGKVFALYVVNPVSIPTIPYSQLRLSGIIPECRDRGNT